MSLCPRLTWRLLKRAFLDPSPGNLHVTFGVGPSHLHSCRHTRYSRIQCEPHCQKFWPIVFPAVKPLCEGPHLCFQRKGSGSKFSFSSHIKSVTSFCCSVLTFSCSYLFSSSSPQILLSMWLLWQPLFHLSQPHQAYPDRCS